jgi:hypothetical protein
LAILAIGLGLSIIQLADLKPSDGALLFAGLLPAAIVWWQVRLIKQQMQLQAIIELDKEWNSPGMLESRKAAWNRQNEPDIENVECVLEFLEKVSTFEKQRVISADLIWDTFGWYVSRYHYYNKDTIADLRRYWVQNDDDKDRVDSTLYMDLESLADKLLKQDVKKRNKRKLSGPDLTEDDVKKEFQKTKIKFITYEKG